jgi:hypothetical protein
MAKMVLTAAYINLTGPGDISGSVSKCELTAEVEEKDVTTFTSLGWKEVLGGLKSGSLALTFKNDLVDDGLDEDMWTVLGTVIAFEVRATQSAVGVSNPKYTGSVLIKGWAPVSGSPGDVNENSQTFPTSGVITRATA